MAHESLHGRQRQILALLRARQDIVTSKEIAAMIEVSDRTVRSDVKLLNSVLDKYGAKIDVIRGKGLLLRTKGDNMEIINSLLYSSEALQTREERVNELLVRLLLSEKGEELGELEEEMFIGRTTLESDIQYIRNLVQSRRPHLKLTRGRNRISIEAPEWRKRLMLTKIYAERWDYHTREGIQLRGTPFEQKIFDAIEEIAKNTIRDCKIRFDDYDLIAFIITIAVAEFRIRTGHTLTATIEPDEKLDEIPAVNIIINEVERVSETAFNEYERRSILLSASFRQSAYSEDRALENDKKAALCAELFIKTLKEQYQVDFFGDKELYAELIRHIYRLDRRMRFSYERKNAMLFTLKTRYIYFFELAMSISDCFQEVYGMSIGEDEWGYFAECLVTSVYRASKLRYPNGIPTAFVSHLGRSDREMLMREISSIYGNTLDLHGPFSMYQKKRIEEAKPELILSTVRLETLREELAHVPHMTINYSVDDDAFLRINFFIREIQEKLILKPLPNIPSSYFDESLFFCDVDVHDEKELICLLIKELFSMGYVSEGSAEEVFRRESISSTAIETGIAIPRLFGTKAIKTCVAVARLRRPIHWSGQKIATAFLLCVSEKDISYYGTLLQYISNDLCRRKILKKLRELTSFEELVELL